MASPWHHIIMHNQKKKRMWLNLHCTKADTMYNIEHWQIGVMCSSCAINDPEILYTNLHAARIWSFLLWLNGMNYFWDDLMQINILLHVYGSSDEISITGIYTELDKFYCDHIVYDFNLNWHIYRGRRWQWHKSWTLTPLL